MRRNGFTLVELIVSVGILGIMVTISGWVFSLTLDSTGQANALMEVTHACKSVERQMRLELANVPRDSVMVIHPHLVNAYWTKDEKDVDADGLPYQAVQSSASDMDHVEYTTDQFDSSNNAWVIQSLHQMPRADVLMFFTATPVRSKTTGTQAGMQMITYAHANLGKLDASTGVFSSTADFDENSYYIEQQDGSSRLERAANADVFPKPANEWHLARRAVAVSNQIIDEDEVAEFPADADLLEGIKDILAPTGTSTDNETIPGFLYTRDVAERIFSLDPVMRSQPIGSLDTWDRVLNDNDGSDYRELRWWNRPKLDLLPTASQADRVGAYMLSNCASFKVEWTFDSPTFNHMKDTPWFDSAVRVPNGSSDTLFPGISIPLNLVLSSAQTGSGLDWERFNEIRYTEIPELATNLVLRIKSMAFAGIGGVDSQKDGIAIFYPKQQLFTDAQITNDPYFPTALRITMEVYDSSGRLDKPIRHTMVLPVGNR